MGGFSDFFRQFFGGGARGPGGSPFGGGAGGFEYVDLSDLAAARTRARPRAIPSAQATAEVTLAEVATGAERMVNVNGRRLHVKIPPGVSDGSKVKLSGAVDGGDLVINVRVKPDPRFERHGADLRTELPLTLAEALLGAEVPVPTPDRQREAAHPPEHPERPGDPGHGPRPAEARLVAEGRPGRHDPGRAAEARRRGAREQLEPILAGIPQPDPRRKLS